MSKTYKPFKYPWAYEAYVLQNQIHWVPSEVELSQDILDWNSKLTISERDLLTQIFRFFTQADIDVANGYINHFMPNEDRPEVRMMMAAFTNMEATHIDAYSQLLDAVGMPDTEYEAFMSYEAMANKHEYLGTFLTELSTRKTISDEQSEKVKMKALAVYSAFTEGLQLFSSFVMLLNFTRFGKMKGMGQIITWSIRDESLHVDSMIKLFHERRREFPHIWTDDFKAELYQVCRDMVTLEDDFVDLAFEMGDMEGLTKEETKIFIRYIADRRLLQLGLKPNYGISENPLPWYDEILNSVEHTNFFENRVTEYSKGATSGDWGDVWNKLQSLETLNEELLNV